ncbi:tectonic-like complex member Mks1 [Musca vetustissima]|uniref:tectonic-like complex member Mks1 n=1 Tax=Musca vetustissima TaxID=27455 RepID=UPI002AB7D07D|nr:tectonic-like complex member Mks1 [Musca vetustissima]
MFNSYPKHSGIYYVKDGIENLQIKIHFRSIGSLLKLPKFEFHNKQAMQDSWKSRNVSGVSEEDDDSTTTTMVTFKWQQKVFSELEKEIYKDEKNCMTEQQRKYHQQLKEEERMAKDKGKLSRKKNRHKKAGKPEVNEVPVEGGQKIIFSYVVDDHFKPKDADVDSSIISKNMLASIEPCEVMYIYAALKPDTQLVVMKWFGKQNLFYIYPDFNQFQIEPYYIELDTDYRHLYAYGIEDISVKLKPQKKEADEFLYLPELSTHWLYEDELSKKFAMPPKRTQRCAVLFTLQEVSGLEYDNIHIRYEIKLPVNTLLEEGLLEGSTHSASANGNGTTHIGYTWQLTILCEEHFDPSQCLRIYFEIISIDSWLRERTEGYCHYSLRLMKPFQHNVDLQCLVPTESFADSLTRYFIGGRRKFDYMRFVKEEQQEEEHVGQIHCRYGVRMRNSGQLKLSCQSLTQRNCELLNPCASRTSGMTLDDIMMAYKEARRRLEAITLK